MNLFKSFILFGLLVISISLSRAVADSRTIDDSDLSAGRGHELRETVPLDLPPDRIEVTPSTAAMSVEVLREVQGEWLPVEGLLFTQVGDKGLQAVTDARGVAKFGGCPTGGIGKLKAVLDHAAFGIVQAGGMLPQLADHYRITLPADCRTHSKVLLRSDSAAGQALGIWQVGFKAFQKLSSALGKDVWSKHINFSWPSDGDYYSLGQVNISRGDHWDVVGHELGHAIYALGGLGRSGGGSHKIDECYSLSLALSEGWATFFSGWVSLGLSDPDARFEHLVPRRAPIRIENVPADVCAGQANEWRVSAFFWDLADLHDDGEGAEAAFERMWKALTGKRVGSAWEARLEFERAGYDKDLLAIVWLLNFKTESP